MNIILNTMMNHGGLKMKDFEVIYAKIIEAEDFFDAVEKAKREDAEILSVAEAPIEEEDVFDA